MCLATSNKLLLVPKKHIISTNNLLVSQKMMQRHSFSTLHPLSPVLFATATVVALVLLHNSRFNFHCYTQREAMPTQKSARKWRCELSCAKNYKGHSLVHTSFTEPSIHNGVSPADLGSSGLFPYPLSFDVSQNVTETKTAHQRRLLLRFKKGASFLFYSVWSSSCGCCCANFHCYSLEQLLWLLLC